MALFWGLREVIQVSSGPGTPVKEKLGNLPKPRIPGGQGTWLQECVVPGQNLGTLGKLMAQQQKEEVSMGESGPCTAGPRQRAAAHRK